MINILLLHRQRKILFLLKKYLHHVFELWNQGKVISSTNFDWYDSYLFCIDIEILKISKNRDKVKILNNLVEDLELFFKYKTCESFNIIHYIDILSIRK